MIYKIEENKKEEDKWLALMYLTYTVQILKSNLILRDAP